MTYEEKIEQLKGIIANTKRGVLFTGAGISVPSGIPDFRSEGGLYGDDIYAEAAEYMLSHSCLVNDCKRFFDFYKKKMLYPNAKPNAAHLYFAELERQGKLAATVTQNIDGLHQAAGAKTVFELHGSVYRNHCSACGKGFDLNYVLESDGIPHCDFCNGIVRPDVVLYEEDLDYPTIEGAARAISNADTLFIVGTSLVVYPAAGLINYLGDDKTLVLINKGKTEKDSKATLAINEDVVRVVRALQKV